MPIDFLQTQAGQRFCHRVQESLGSIAESLASPLPSTTSSLKREKGEFLYSIEFKEESLVITVSHKDKKESHVLTLVYEDLERGLG